MIRSKIMSGRGVSIWAALAATAVVAGVFVSAGAAQAAPYNCPISGSGNSRSAICVQGTGSYRVAIQCDNSFTRTYDKTVYGPWISTSYMRPSVAWCDWYEYVGAAGAQTS